MVNPIIGGALIGGVADLIGGERANRQNAAQNEADRQHQLHMAKNQVQMRMADARAAGVSPFAAMGMSPVSASGTSRPMQNTLAGMGQGIAAAGASMQTPAQKSAENLALENQRLQNDMLKTELAKSTLALMRARNPMSMSIDSGDFAGVGTNDLSKHGVHSQHLTVNHSGRPIARSGPTAEVALAFPHHVRSRMGPAYIKPVEVEGASGHNVMVTAGDQPAYTYVRQPNGAFKPVPSEAYKRAIEDNIFDQATEWAWRFWDKDQHRPGFEASPGHSWKWNGLKGTWEQVPTKGPYSGRPSFRGRPYFKKRVNQRYAPKPHPRFKLNPNYHE